MILIGLFKVLSLRLRLDVRCWCEPHLRMSSFNYCIGLFLLYGVL